MVPGGAFGPSKCWPSERFAKTADRLINDYDATVIVSVSPDPAEKRIAEQICGLSEHELINLAEKGVSLGQLKSLFSIADLVITNDTGPRHIATAMHRRTISLFGPNDPAWTDIGCETEIQITGDAPCAPCAKSKCEEDEHLCMEAITVEMVYDAAKKLLDGGQPQIAPKYRQNFLETSKSFFVDDDYAAAFRRLGLTSIDAVFSFESGKSLNKPNLAKHRSRIQFEIELPILAAPATLFLKRYDRPPILLQLRNWLSHRKRACLGFFDRGPTDILAAAGINTPRTICYGRQWGTFFEKRSFVITQKIPNAESIERKLPDYFNLPVTVDKLKLRRNFIIQLADFVNTFHATKYRHRDLYFSHIFHSSDGRFYLIDLARIFKPTLLSERFRIKDIAQLYYSAPQRHFSGTDRLRFFLRYAEQDKLTPNDKAFIRKVINKAYKMAAHDIKHNRTVPFTK